MCEIVNLLNKLFLMSDLCKHLSVVHNSSDKTNVAEKLNSQINTK